jgi:structure-specific recognition protein 1
MGRKRSKEDKETEEEVLEEFKEPDEDDVDPKIAEEMKIIEATEPKSELEIALTETLKRRELYIKRLTAEVSKLKDFVRKRKQTYKRKRKDEGAPTRALSAYNIFVQDRFAKLSKENEQALKSADAEAYLKRVPPSSLVASTGNAWKALSAEEKQVYEERAKEDRKRYEEQMSKYQPPEKGSNRKRNKTGYNMFFSAHVMRLKSAEGGVPSERGSVARLVGNAWKVRSGQYIL